jgi:hypothetical protein
MELPGLPNWDIESEEDSAGVYHLRATHSSGASFETQGHDIVVLVQKLEEYDAQLERS